MLSYYEKVMGFTALDVNYTYYALASKKTMESFLRSTSDSFSFTVTAFKGIIHDKNDVTRAQFKMFKEGISPLGKNLKALLFQFPYAFVPNQENIDYLKVLKMNSSITSRSLNSGMLAGSRMGTWISLKHCLLVAVLQMSQS